MAKHANPTAVGGFIVGAVVLTVAGIVTFGSGDWFREEYEFVAYFEDSVSGLDVGAPIRYKGVQVGNVTGIKAAWHVPDEELRIPVELTLIEGATESASELEDAYPDVYAFVEHLIVERGMKAELQQDSFVTGKLFVALDFVPDDPIRRSGDSALPEIPTTQGGLSKLKKSIEDLPIEQLIDEAIAAVDAIEKLASNKAIDETLTNLNALVAKLDAQVDPVAEDARALMKSVNSEVTMVSTDARGLLENANAEIDALSTSAQGTMDKATEALASVNQTFGEEYPLYHRVAVLLEELGGAARAVRMLADYLERHPEALISGKAGQ